MEAESSNERKETGLVLLSKYLIDRKSFFTKIRGQIIDAARGKLSQKDNLDIDFLNRSESVYDDLAKCCKDVEFVQESTLNLLAEYISDRVAKKDRIVLIVFDIRSMLLLEQVNRRLTKI